MRRVVNSYIQVLALSVHSEKESGRWHVQGFEFLFNVLNGYPSTSGLVPAFWDLVPTFRGLVSAF